MIKKRLFSLLSDSLKYVYSNIVLQILSLLAQMFIVASICIVVSKVIDGSVNIMDYIMMAILFFGAIIIRVLCDEFLARGVFLASFNVKLTLRKAVFQKLIDIGPSYKEHISTSEVVQLCSEGVEQLEIYFGRYITQLFYSLIAPFLLFGVFAYYVDVKIAAVLLLTVFLIPLSIVLLMKMAKKLLQKHRGIYINLGNNFLENLQGLTTVKMYMADSFKAKQMDEEASHFRKIMMKVLTMQLYSITIMDIFAYGGVAVGMILALLEYFRGNIGIIQVLVVVLLSMEFFMPMRILGSYFHIAMNGMAVSDKIFALLDLPIAAQGSVGMDADISDAKVGDADASLDEADTKDEDTLKNHPLKNHALDVVFEGVGFSYLQEETKILEDISFSIPSGGFVSIVGESASGKSTIAKLLTGKNTGYSGSIRIGGVELRDIKRQHLLEEVVLVRSDSYIFKGTIAQNLRFANPFATDAQLLDVLQKVNLRCFIEQRDRLDTMLEEKGSNISGGQAQRIAIARALLANPSIMIFDEATSNIDTESEEMIMQVIHKLAKEKTILLISHRLANVVPSDKILMLKEGRIVESGNHLCLMEEEGEYSRIFNMQESLERVSNQKEIPVSTIHLHPVRSHRKEKEPEKTVMEGSRRSGCRIMASLIGLIKPLSPVMLIGILTGAVGYLSAIFIHIHAVRLLSRHFIAQNLSTAAVESRKLIQSPEVLRHFQRYLNPDNIRIILLTLLLLALLRGGLHYIEQYCNHYIAFKILATLRHKVFKALCRLAPAKQDQKDKGNLISIITTDIELLEVFYAHTISPIAIGFVASLFMLIYIGTKDWIAAIILLKGYICVGVMIPLFNGGQRQELGMLYRQRFGELAGLVLSKLRGLDEILQFAQGEQSLEQIQTDSEALMEVQDRLYELEGKQKMMTNSCMLMTTFTMLMYSLYALSRGRIMLDSVFVFLVVAMGSFGPVVALSNLSNHLNQTLASGERVLQIFEEVSWIDEVYSKTKQRDLHELSFSKVSFAYPNVSAIYRLQNRREYDL